VSLLERRKVLAVGKPRITVFGAGSRMMGDERAGIAVLEALAERVLPEGVSLRETGTDGYGLVNDLEGCDAAIIVDCADMGQAPGTVLAFGPDEVESTVRDRRMSMHSVNLLGVVRLAQQLGTATRIRIVGIQPQVVEMGEELTGAVAAAVPRAVALVKQEIAAALAAANARCQMPDARPNSQMPDARPNSQMPDAKPKRNGESD
jgi:hydrogenase maturation protease